MGIAFRPLISEYISTLEGDIAECDCLSDHFCIESENLTLRQEITSLKKAEGEDGMTVLGTV